jgi:hypothetical protein
MDANQNTESSHIKLDISLATPEERIAKVNEIIAATPAEKLTPKYLTILADYIMFLDDKQKRKELDFITDNKLVTINKRETSYEGLAGKLENGEDGIYNMMTNDKTIIFSPKTKITKEEYETIPGLKELLKAITDAEAEFKVATGKRKFFLKQQIIQMRQDQYVIRNAYKKPIYSRNIVKSMSKLDLSEHVTIDAEGAVHSDGTINFFEPAHIVSLLCNYSELKMETWDKFDSDMKWALIDLENLIDRTLKDEYPLYYDLLIYKIDGKQNAEIQQLLYEKHGIKHTEEYISALWRNKIPKLICKQAEIEYLEWYYTNVECGKWKKCTRCGQIKLAHNYFFSKNRTSKDGYYSICKCCRNKKTKEKKKG